MVRLRKKKFVQFRKRTVRTCVAVFLMLILIIINSTNTQNSIGYADTSQNSDIALSENAKLCEDESVMLLSKNDAYKVGGFWLKQPVSMKNGVTITFDYKMTGVGDGFAVGYSSEMKEIKNNTPNVMGLPIDEDSMVIEFDGYKNDFDPSAPNNKHIGVNKDVSTHLATGYTTKINDDIWHSAKILMTGEGIIVIIDNTVSLYYKSKINLLEKGFIGFCAFNGEYRSDYYIKNYAVSQSASLDGFDYNENRLSYNSHIYEIVDRGKITYGEAKAYCISQGGHLATITSQEENDAVYQYLVSKGHMSAYFGLEEEQEGVWRWVNGEELSYLNWGGGEPNNANGNESYGMFYKNYLDGKWNDGGFLNGCTSYDVSTFICEWDSAEDYSGSGASPELQKEFVQKHIDFAASPQYQNRQNENLIKNYTDAILSKKAGAAARVWKYIMKAPTILTDWEEYLENPYRAVLATLFLKEDYLANYNRAFEEGCEAKIQKTASLIMKYLQQTDIQLSESEIRELESCLLTKHKELNNSELGKKVSEKIGRFSQSQLETLFSDLDYYTGLAQETIDFWSRIKKSYGI